MRKTMEQLSLTAGKEKESLSDVESLGHRDGFGSAYSSFEAVGFSKNQNDENKDKTNNSDSEYEILSVTDSDGELV